MKYPISKVTNTSGKITEEIIDVFDCKLDEALERFKNIFDGVIDVQSVITYECTEGQYYQVPVITCTEQDGDTWIIYRMPLWVSE